MSNRSFSSGRTTSRGRCTRSGRYISSGCSSSSGSCATSGRRTSNGLNTFGGRAISSAQASTCCIALEREKKKRRRETGRRQGGGHVRKGSPRLSCSCSSALDAEDSVLGWLPRRNGAKSVERGRRRGRAEGTRHLPSCAPRVVRRSRPPFLEIATAKC